MGLNKLVPGLVDDLRTQWPTEPRTVRRGRNSLDQSVSLDLINSFIDDGCLAPADVIVVKDAVAVHPDRYISDGQIRRGRLRQLVNEGHTLSLRNLQRRIPYLGQLSAQLHAETGYPNHISGYLTPPGSTGLRHHWDTFTVFVAQIEGQKVWDLFVPTVEAPLFQVPFLSASVIGFTDAQKQRFAGPPDQAVTLVPGDTLILPRGWVHAPRTVGEGPSWHLTFAVKERSVSWAMSQLAAASVREPRYRAEIPPAALTGDLLPHLSAIRAQMVSFLNELDLSQVAEEIKQATLK